MILEIPSYAPDLSDYEARGTLTLLNVLPRSDGYGPFQDFQALTSAIASGNDSFAKVLLHFEGADAGTVITDNNAGGSAHVWTAAGNANTDNAQTKFGLTSLATDGTGDWVSTPDHADFNLGTSSFAIEVFFRCTATAGSVKEISGQGADLTTAATLSFNIIRNASNQIQASVSNGTTLTTLTSTTTFTDAVNTGWHHAKVSRSDTTLSLTIDGTLEDSDTLTGTVPNVADALFVGKGSTGSSAGWIGWLDEYRLSVGDARSGEAVPTTMFNTSAACRGYFYARNNDGSITVFAGTATKLYKLNNTLLNWTDVSKSFGSYTSVPTADQWQFAQFNNFVFAVQTGTVPQVFDLTTSTNFADLGGSPPQARYIAVVNRFLVLSGLTSSTPYRVHWSGFNDTTQWTAGTNQSDTYDMPDGGIVRSIAGGEYGIVTQDSTIRRMVYSPGSPVVFQFDRISEEKGILAPLSMVRGGDRVFYYGNDGFQMVPPGQYPQPIGKERVDRYFARTADLNAPQYIIGAADPRAGRVFWSFRTAGSSASLFDQLLCYDYVLDKWSIIAMQGEYMATLAAPGITLESLDSISGSIDALVFSLDDVSTSALARLSIFNASHILGFFSGDSLEATLVTAEKSGEGRRLRVRGFRPVTDAVNIYGSVSKREGLNDTAQFSSETLINVYGVCPANVSTRNARAKLRVPAGEDWTFVTGIEPDVAIEGRR